jgi:hypothetical protein
MDTSLKIDYSFFGGNLELSFKDRHDPSLMKLIVDIEMWEIEKGKGLEYVSRMENAGLMIGDENVHNSIKNILEKRHEHERR